MSPAFLVLEDGTILEGTSFGAAVDSTGEVVFQTGMVGYPQSLTDPSYHQQILVLTYPMIGNYGIPDPEEKDQFGLPKWMESHRVWPSGLIVAEYCSDYSHWKATMSLGDYLKEQGVPGIQGIDTRALTKKIRDSGSIKGMIIQGNVDAIKSGQFDLIFPDPNLNNLVKEVSTKVVSRYNVQAKVRVAVIDVGVKMHQLHCLIQRGLGVDLVPWDYPLMDHIDQYQGVFVSNGPGDPAMCDVTIETLTKLVTLDIPIFGICLGHQLLARCIGSSTSKLKFGNRGHNQPVRFMDSPRCFVTSQNHGYAVEATSLPSDWVTLFTNLNDDSNEGISHRVKPIFSVQFHPEHRAGPEDMTFLFDIFVGYVIGSHDGPVPQVICDQLHLPTEVKVERPRKVLILGSGGLSIGQAGEFDYSGSQAIKALKEEHVQTVLINPNIATVQTSPEMADKVYFLPITPEYVEQVIAWERPDAIMLMFGGQTALNCGIQLDNRGILTKFQVKIMGTPIHGIIQSEDRDQFAQIVHQVGAQVVKSRSAKSEEEAVTIAATLGYPVLVRAAYALGGLGSGFADSEHDLRQLVTQCLVHSESVFIDKSLKGWKEVEYEVVRDAYDNCITVCNMENFDPLGVHTGESIVVAPSQTLSDQEYQSLRNVSIAIGRKVGVIGECNVQFALSPNSEQFFVVEMNARLSRSSALASKATGYPLAYVAAKLALGHSLHSLHNNMTKKTALFEPSLDYCVVKIPRWDLGKFTGVTRNIGSSMKSVGEVMAIGRRFEEAFQKALRMVDESVNGFDPNIKAVNEEELRSPTDDRIFVVASALKQGYTIAHLNQLTNIDPWFLTKCRKIIDLHQRLDGIGVDHLTPNLLKEAKQLGFSDKQISRLVGSTELVIRKIRRQHDLRPWVKQVDTVSAEWPAFTNYLYMTYNGTEDDIPFGDEGNGSVMVLGSGVYRIGSSVEFDCCAVGCVQTLRKLGKSTIMVNYNPETVSTDYDMCDKLYFEEISFEVVMDVYERENPTGIILSMGGQLPNNIAMDLHRQKAKILGTSAEAIDGAENRFKFSRTLDKMVPKIYQPEWKELTDVTAAQTFCRDVGYPCIVRPSYVLSGAAMNVATTPEELENYLKQAVSVSRDHPVVISKFVMDAKEIDVDAVAQHGQVICMAVSEHVENAGVHSGDATLVTPPQDLNPETLNRIRYICEAIGKEMAVNGPFNMQLIAKDNQLKVIECNLRVSRSFPFVSKTLGYDFVSAATRIMVGEKMDPVDVTHGAFQSNKRVGVKVAQFSFSRLAGADYTLGVEMASTGEVAAFGDNRYEAYLKALMSTGFKMPRKGGNILLSIGSYKHKSELLTSVRMLHKMGFNLSASMGTADFYREQGVHVHQVEWPYGDDGPVTHKPQESLIKFLAEKDLDLVINLPMRTSGARRVSTHGYRCRRFAVDFAIPLITDVKCAKLFVQATKLMGDQPMVKTHIDCLTSQKIVRLPGMIDVHVHFREPGQTWKEDFSTGSAAALSGGITMICAMPNTDPPVATINVLSMTRELAASKAKCDYGLFMMATSDNHGEWDTLKDRVTPSPIGLKVYMNDTFIKDPMRNMACLTHHLESFPSHLPICVHAEGLTVAAIIMLSQLVNRSIHVCHVAREEEIQVIKRAKDAGMKITCEVAPHHLFLSEEDIVRLGQGWCEVRPVLVSKRDQQSLWKHLDTIDVFASDHAPHTREEKMGKNAPPGFPGVDTMVPLLLNAVNEGRLTLEDLVMRLYTNPKKIFNIPDQVDTYVEVDMAETWDIGSVPSFSRSAWTPFDGMKVTGKVRRVVLRGELVFVDDMVLAPDGFGKEVTPEVKRKVSTAVMATTTSATTNGDPEITSAMYRHMMTELKSPEKVTHKRERIRFDSFTDEITNQDELRRMAASPTLPFTSYQQLGDLKGVNVLSAAIFKRDVLHTLFNLAQQIKKKSHLQQDINPILMGKVMGSLFFEPSTRTSCSFASAMMRLGGQVVTFTPENSSQNKGETFEDTVSTVACYSDLLVIRHSEPAAHHKIISLSAVAGKPVINAGDGIGEHPTQALLDVFTIREEIGTVNGIIITLVGDLLNGRTVHSLARLLTLYEVKEMRYVSPANLKMPQSVMDIVSKAGITQKEYSSLEEAIKNTDVLYMTRIQKERFKDPNEYDRSCGLFTVTPELMTKAKDRMIVMHPLPRLNEVDTSFDTDPRAAYFRQMENGMYVRMALLCALFGRTNI